MITITLWALVLFNGAGEPAMTWTQAAHYASFQECDQARSWYPDSQSGKTLWACIPQTVKVAR